MYFFYYFTLLLLLDVHVETFSVIKQVDGYRNWKEKSKNHLKIGLKISINCSFSSPYRLHSCQYINRGTIQLLPVGHNVSQRVEIGRVLRRQVHQRQQPVDRVHVRAQQHPGMRLDHQQPVRADRTRRHFRPWLHYPWIPPVLHNFSAELPHCSSAVRDKLDKQWGKCYLGVAGQNLSFSGSLLETKGFSTVTGNRKGKTQ